MEKRLESQLIAGAMPVVEGSVKSVNLEMKITNEDRAFGSTLSYEISR